MPSSVWFGQAYIASLRSSRTLENQFRICSYIKAAPGCQKSSLHMSSKLGEEVELKVIWTLQLNFVNCYNPGFLSPLSLKTSHENPRGPHWPMQCLARRHTYNSPRKRVVRVSRPGTPDDWTTALYYKFNSLNFDSEKISETTLWDHLKWKEM